MTLYTNYTAAQAAARAKLYTSWQVNYCLNFTRTMLHGNTPLGGLPDAKSAYYAATQRVKTGTPPAGAPVYWKTYNHPYWHIAVSLGDGYVRSTDYPTKGTVSKVSISRLTSLWGMTYMGWSRDLAGRVIRGLEVPTAPVPSPPVTAIPAPANYSEATALVINDEALRLGGSSGSAEAFNKRVWSWLYWQGGTVGRSFCTTNYKAWQAEPARLFGTMSIKAMNKMYQILDGGTPNYTYPGANLLKRLGLRADAG